MALFLAVLLIAVGFTIAAFRFSTKAAGWVNALTGILWTLCAGLLTLNEYIFQDDENLREMGEWFALAPLVLAIPLSPLAIGLLLARIHIYREEG